MRPRILIFIALLLSTAASAQIHSAHFERRAFSFGAGHTSLLDTYLSPLRYSGANVALQSERFGQSVLGGGQWFNQSTFTLHGDYTTPAPGSGLTVGGTMDYSYTLYYRFSPKGGRCSLYVGPQGQIRLGGIYNLRNSNNPAQLKFGSHVAASALGRYAFALWNTPMHLSLQTDVPLLGVAFGPDFGQSYYEIFYLGQARGCIHMTSLHNNLSLRTTLGYGVEFPSCTVRLTLLSDLYQWSLGGQQYRMFTHSIMLGYAKNLYHVRRDDEAREYIPY